MNEWMNEWIKCIRHKSTITSYETEVDTNTCAIRAMPKVHRPSRFEPRTLIADRPTTHWPIGWWTVRVHEKNQTCSVVIIYVALAQRRDAAVVAAPSTIRLIHSRCCHTTTNAARRRWNDGQPSSQPPVLRRSVDGGPTRPRRPSVRPSDGPSSQGAAALRWGFDCRCKACLVFVKRSSMIDSDFSTTLATLHKH